MRDETHSFKDYTGARANNLDVLDGLTIEGSCFSQEIPDSHIFRDDMTGVTFIGCNLDNVFIPNGNIVIGCSQNRFEVQNDLEDWHIDANDDPVVPINEKQFLQLGLSIDPADIPDQPMESPVTVQYSGDLLLNPQ